MTNLGVCRTRHNHPQQIGPCVQIVILRIKDSNVEQHHTVGWGVVKHRRQ